ncbi:MAG: 50S ribosomal protein L9 [Acidimicrobiaceae bacterium]|jgi:large subunit ribosomal protein L9|nr:50S ribosomal protein L9 [Acidimicrobiaceae bacterium]MBT6447054.1 50S ribosomal protein L9 [Acidimicrobiaceae bacterium]MCO4833124.1 50S ribosomal protein L9 [Acidimicrobiaceae bacterium]MDB4818425.1 50S ribosomal protein L9 [Acidimicrobiales bacterium]
MKIVLRDNVDGLGKRGEVLDVADGYSRNYLIPQGLAMRATPGAEAEAIAMRRVEDQRNAQSRDAANALAQRIGATPMVIAARASDEGRLFGSVGPTEIIAAAAHAGLELDRRVVAMDEPIKELGDHSVTLVLHPEVKMAISVSVISDEA